MSLAISLPASLLLAGEYLILREGGLGLAAAPDIRIQASSEPAPNGKLKVTGLFGRERLEWRERSGPAGLIPTVLATIREKYHLQHLPPIEITLDSRPLYAADGRKLGFGSSAAAGTALIALLSAEISGSLPQEEELLQTSITAHRKAQGGRGSGYDIACSIYGGVGLFRGGSIPDWRRLHLPWLRFLELRNFADPVSSAAAVRTFEEYYRLRPERIEALLKRNNELLLSFRSDLPKEAGIKLIEQCRDLGIELGREIGVNAALPVDEDQDWKASGAGDELGFRLSSADNEQAIPITGEGIRRE